MVEIKGHKFFESRFKSWSPSHLSFIISTISVPEVLVKIGQDLPRGND